MIPEHRLAVLLDQWQHSQVAKCLYHNPLRSPSLFTDHVCERSQFPLQTIAELSQSNGEVWCVEFSHNGQMLAASGSDPVVVIYDMSNFEFRNFEVRNVLKGHGRGIVHVSWSPDDSRLITCSQDHLAKVWNIHVRFPVDLMVWALTGVLTDWCLRSGNRPSQPRSDNSCLGA